MSRIVPRLGRAERDVLVRLSDPGAPPPASLPGDVSLDRIVDFARRHSVLPIIRRKLLASAAPDSDAAGWLQALEPEIVIATGQSMLLAHRARAFSAALRKAGIAFAIVKGAVFAERLYAEPSDRPFTDVDFLVGMDDIAAANAIFAAEGLVPDDPERQASEERYCEYKWTSPENDTLLFEVHGDLLHYPGLRRRRSFGYRQLLEAGEGDVEAPAALLVVAIVHAALGHKFHSLRLVVDVLQAARALPPEADGDFVDRITRLGFAFEAAVSLDLAAGIFGDVRAAELACRFRRGPRRAVSSLLLDVPTIIDAAATGNGLSRTRRAAFRTLQQAGSLGLR